MKRPSWLAWPLAAPRLSHPPTPPDRNPIEFSIYVCCTIIVARTAVGVSPLPGSLQAAPDVFGRLTAITIAGGSLIAVIGFLWRDRTDGIIIQQLGCAGLGFGALFYVVALLINSPFHSAAIVAGVFLGISIGCTWRWVLIQRWVNYLKRTQGEADRRETQ